MLAGALFTRWVRAYPWELAMVSGVLLGGLVFATVQTIARLRATLRQFGSKD